MNKISVSQQLHGLPYPLCLTSTEQRHREMKKLSSTMEVKTALDVLERGLHAISQLKDPLEYDIPESLIDYWSFSGEFLAERIPTFEKFDLNEVKPFLEEEGIENPSENVIINVAEYWIWWAISNLVNELLRWLQKKLKQEENPAQVDKFLEIASKYWEKVDPNLASSLLSDSAFVGWKKALPLLESVEQNWSGVPYVKETAQDYRAWILK